MNRRAACLALALAPLLAAKAARGQSGKPARVAWVTVERTNPDAPFFAAFRSGMRELGWIEGKNLTLDAWWGQGSAKELARQVPQLVTSRPDVVVAAGGPVVRVLIDARVELPVVFTYSGDVVMGKVVESYSRPGVNRTGISFFSLELVPKRLEVLKEVLPGLKRLAITGWPRHAGEPMELQAAAGAAAQLGLAHAYYPVTTQAELSAALEKIRAWRADAVLAFADGVIAANAAHIAQFSLKHRIPSMSGWAVFAEKGNLMTYGPNLRDSYARLSSIADRVLKGGRPAEMPIERPTSIELVINARTARALGVTIPEAVRLRTSRVIE